MTGTTPHSEECKKAQCAIRRRALRMARRKRCELWIACISSVLSLILIVLVVLLMSFIEFQSRLANSRSDIAPSQLVNRLLEGYEKDDAIATYTELAADSAAKRRQANVVAAERNYRIDRICSIFCPALRTVSDGSAANAVSVPSSDAGSVSEGLRQTFGRVERCRFFLSKIPFEGTATPPGRMQRLPPPLPADQLRSAEIRTSNQLGQVILNNFLSAMGGRDDGVAAYGARLQEQLLKIAEANRHLTVDLEPEVKRLDQESLIQCKRVDALGGGSENNPYAKSFCAADWLKNGVPDRLNTFDRTDICGQSPAADCQKCSATPAATPPTTPPAATPPAEPSSQQKAESVAGGPILKNDDKEIEKGERVWEFVTHFRLYHDLTFGIARRLILSPPDYLAQWLLLFGGALGAMLNILFKHLAPGRSNKWTDLVVEPVQGMACAIIVFILFRSGFVVISGQQESNETATLNSYFVAFIAIGAGMLSEQALLAFRNAASALFGRVELRGTERWAPGLQAALGSAPAAPTDVRTLARRINEKEDAVDKWVRMAEPVPADMQTKIVMALGIEPAKLFTDVRPDRVTPPDIRLAGAGGAAGGVVVEPAPGADAGAGEPKKPEEQ